MDWVEPVLVLSVGLNLFLIWLTSWIHLSFLFGWKNIWNWVVSLTCGARLAASFPFFLHARSRLFVRPQRAYSPAASALASLPARWSAPPRTRLMHLGRTAARPYCGYPSHAIAHLHAASICAHALLLCILPPPTHVALARMRRILPPPVHAASTCARTRYFSLRTRAHLGPHGPIDFGGIG